MQQKAILIVSLLTLITTSLTIQPTHSLLRTQPSHLLFSTQPPTRKSGLNTYAGLTFIFVFVVLTIYFIYRCKRRRSSHSPDEVAQNNQNVNSIRQSNPEIRTTEVNAELPSRQFRNEGQWWSFFPYIFIKIVIFMFIIWDGYLNKQSLSCQLSSFLGPNENVHHVNFPFLGR